MEARIEDLARRKALAVADGLKGTNSLVLSADTVVVVDHQILGKPSDEGENLSYLRQMSGREHIVITAVCLVNTTTGESLVGHGLSRIHFRQLGEDEMLAYVRSRDGLDKAGGYGIQGAAGAFVDRLEGEFDNVMGLPVSVVQKMLESRGWNVDR